MNENIGDLLSLVIVCAVPLGALLTILLKLFSKRKIVKKEKEGKYYPEW